MVFSGAVQALIAAFVFGMLTNTASAGFILYIKGHGSALFRDGLRLALILFLASSALWAQVGFFSTLIDPTEGSTCQVAVIVSTLLDQFARVSIEQFLIWVVAKDGLKSAAGLATQILLFARFIVGMVFVGETKPQFNSTCVPLSNVVPVAIAVIALDAVILTSIAVLAVAGGTNKNGPGSKTVLLTIAALAVWMGTSVTMLLGFDTTDMVFRTTLPATGLSILTALVTLFSGSLLTSRERRPRLPESPTPQNMNRDLDLSTSGSNEYPPSRYEEVKGINGMTVTQFQMPNGGDNNSGLPTLARPVTGVTGVGGVPVRGQLFPPLRANTVDQVPMSISDVKARTEVPKRSKTVPSKVGKGKLAISAPIPMNDPQAQDAFSKIPTVDLATAAKNEQERREVHARRVSALIANRPAPKPPVITPEEAAKRSMNLSRREVAREPSAEIERANSTKSSQAGSLSVQGNASSTSAQLSPGSEELRRRSPRQTAPATLPAKTPTNSSTFQPITPGQPFRIPIPRAAEPSPAKVSEPVKTPLQRRPTIGLPSNPRAQAMKKTAESGNSQPPTVMFINKISYDDPAYVNDIIQGATKTPFSPLESSNSVVHRPRPIPRKDNKDRQVFPAEIYTANGHRRTKSGGSIMSRRSMLPSQPGTPTQLPPLPPPPKSAGTVSRPQPNDTKSMTFDEKMSMFYTGPPSASSTSSAADTVQKKSSVPELPPLPQRYQLPTVSPTAQQPTQLEEERRLTRTTMTDQTSIRTQSILGVDDLGEKYPLPFGGNTADDGSNSWLPRVPSRDTTNQGQHDGNKRQSSPVIPAIRYSNLSGMSEAKSPNDGSTNWGAVYSPIAPFDVSTSRLNANSTYIKKDSRFESVISGFGDEVMTVMLDTSSDVSTNNRQSFFLGDEESIPDVPKVEKPVSGQWHHRIGEDCPTFSTRKKKAKSRKMPPPTPLLLRAARNQNAVVVHTAEPSPVESPSAAYQEIQAQLRRFDNTNRDSVASEGKRLALLNDLELEMGQQESRWQTMQYNLGRDSISTVQTDSRPVSIVTPAKPVARSSSTKSLLAEQRASRRSRMINKKLSQEEFVAAASSVPGPELPPASLFQTRLAAAQTEFTNRASDMHQKRSNMNFITVSKADLGSPTPPDTDESDTEIMARFESLNAKIAKLHVEEIHSMWQPKDPLVELPNKLLWEAPLRGSKSDNVVELPGISVRPVARKNSEPLAITSSQLWQKPSQPREPRPGYGLWGKIVTQKSPALQPPQKARPLTQRPPRRNKRVTLLPDIIENPEPLPDKRGTLGIFQFAWGERSENATIQSRQTFMAMPGTMSSGGPRLSAALEAKASQREAEEYSSSFFDDYEEEDEDDEEANLDDEFEDSGDDFDENTLWEIASLLKTDVPSKNSLFLPQFRSSVADSDIAAEDSLEDEVRELFDATHHAASEETPSATPLFFKYQDEAIRTSLWIADDQATLSRQSLGLPQPEEKVWQSYIPDEADTVRSRAQTQELSLLESHQMWMPTTHLVTAKPSLWTPVSTSAIGIHLFGLPQPVLAVWETYLPDDEDAVRSHSHVMEIRAIESNSLWKAANDSIETADSLLWAAPRQKVETLTTSSSPSKSASLQPQRQASMWTKPAAVLEIGVDGLFNAGLARSDFRKTLAAPAAVSMVTRPRATKEPLQTLATQRLWKSAPKLVARTTGKRQTMWSPTSVRLASTTTLFHLDPTRKVYRTTAAEPAAVNMTTRPRKSNAALPRLETSEFWSKNNESKVEVYWLKLSSTQRLPRQSSASMPGLFQLDGNRKVWRTTAEEPAASNMMTRPRTSNAPLPQLQTSDFWSKNSQSKPEVNWIMASSASVRSSRATASNPGLFELDGKRKVWRTTSEEPAALNVATKPRNSNAPLPKLQTSKFWSKNNESKVEVNWIKISSIQNLPRQPTASKQGLFQVDGARKIWRTTSKEPAALHMVTRPRTIIAPAPELESSNLWTPTRTANVEFDWITISSVRPRSPSILSVAYTDSTPSSPVTDASSIRTASTMASTVAPSISSFASFRNFFERKKKADPRFPGVPEEAEEHHPVPRIPDEPFIVKNLDLARRRASTPVPHHRTIATSANWEAALLGAIKASHISPKIIRRTASPREWSVALNKAIAASYPQNRFSRGQVLPSQWDEELCEAIAKSRRAVFDASKRHPVFFGSMTATSADVHPAMFGMVKGEVAAASTAATEQLSLLWSKVASSSMSRSPMWTPSLAPTRAVETAILPAADSMPIRKPSQRTTASDNNTTSTPDFAGRAMWKRQNLQAEERDWLEYTTKKHFSHVELRY